MERCCPVAAVAGCHQTAPAAYHCCDWSTISCRCCDRHDATGFDIADDFLLRDCFYNPIQQHYQGHYYSLLVVYSSNVDMHIYVHRGNWRAALRGSVFVVLETVVDGCAKFVVSQPRRYHVTTIAPTTDVPPLYAE